ncbi:MAG: hypothetical protein ACTHN5_12170 [Phycisphaerae bacterium]
MFSDNGGFPDYTAPLAKAMKDGWTWGVRLGAVAAWLVKVLLIAVIATVLAVKDGIKSFFHHYVSLWKACSSNSNDV